MIQPLRRRHLWMTSLVCLLVLPIYIFGRSAANPVIDEKPFSRAEEQLALASESLIEEGVFVALPEASYRLFQGGGEDGSLRIEVSKLANMRRPALLGFWQPSPTASEEPLSNGVLLGTWNINVPASFVLPDTASMSPGAFVLYDQAKEEIVATLSLNP